MLCSLIIPCYNEAENLSLLLERCKAVVESGDVEVILVDNGSSDETPSVLQRLLPKYPGCRSTRVDVNQGYGFGIISGLREAQGEILAWTHADMQTDPQDVLRGLKVFKGGRAISYFVKGRRYGRPMSDTIFTIGMSVFETLLLRKRLWDINAQPTMFHRTFFESWKEPPDDFSLDLFAYHQARVAGFTIKRIPVLFAERAHGKSHWNIDWASKRKFIKRTVIFSLNLRKQAKK